MAIAPTLIKKTTVQLKRLSLSPEKQADDAAEVSYIGEEAIHASFLVICFIQNSRKSKGTRISTPVKKMKILPECRSLSLDHQADTAVEISSSDEEGHRSLRVGYPNLY